MKKVETSKRLALIRDLMKLNDVHAYIVNSEDCHFNEYVHPHHDRRAFISGFSGSSGTVIITLDQAALWTDGRYFEEAKNCLDNNWILMKQNVPGVPSMQHWLSTNLKPGQKVGFDPWILGYSSCNQLYKTCEEYNLILSPINSVNLVDLVWDKLSLETCTEENYYLPRPLLKLNKIRPMPPEFTGKSCDSKIDDIKDFLLKENFAMLVIIQLDEISWLFNARGSDIPNSNTFFAYSIVTKDEVYLFIHPDTKRASKDFLTQLTLMQNKVIVEDYSNFKHVYSSLLKRYEEDRMVFSPSDSDVIVRMTNEERRHILHSPIQLAKAQKNESELSCSIKGHLLDSVLLCEFFSWLENLAKSYPEKNIEINNLKLPHMLKKHDSFLNADNTRIDEKFFTDLLNQCRASISTNIGPSFSTIFSLDSNTSIIHYHASETNSKLIKSNSIVLCDSGGQYEALCTTDVTRTLSLSNELTELNDFIDDYNLVLRSHAYLAQMQFPNDTPGSKLDTIARHIFWSDLKDFQHGTGHGVGSALCVHEGPIGLSGSRLKFFADFGLKEPGIKENMILTIEPGFYREKNYGIRLENCYYTKISSKNVDFLEFQPLTYVPFQRKLIKSDRLSSVERDWLNSYHSQVFEKITNAKEILGPLLEFELSQSMLDWLRDQTRPI